MNITPITWQTQLVDPVTGRPTQTFISIWQRLLTLGLADLADVSFDETPADGDTLVYSEAKGKWVLNP